MSVESYLMDKLGIFQSDTRRLLILQDAMYYAGLENYTENPISVEQQTLNEMFLVQATSYYSRRILDPLKDRNKIYEIREYEFSTLARLRSSLK